MLCGICPSPAGLYTEILEAHLPVHNIGGAWALSHRVLLRHPTCTRTQELYNFVWILGKSYRKMSWHNAWRNNLMSFPYSHYTLNSLLPQKSELASSPLKTKCPWILYRLPSRCWESIMCQIPSLKKTQRGKEKDKSKQKTSCILKWEPKGEEIPHQQLYSVILARFQTSDFTAK